MGCARSTSRDDGGRPRRAWIAAVAVAASLAIAAGARAQLPGIGFHEVTPETFAAFTSTVKMLAPPDPEGPQAWVSAAAEFTGTGASAAPNSLDLVEPVPEGAYGGLRVRFTGTSLAAGQIQPSLSPATIAEGLRSALGEQPLAEIQRHVAAIVTVSEDEIIHTKRMMWEVLKSIVERNMDP